MTRQRKGATTDSLADGMMQARFPNRFREGTEPVTFDAAEIDVILALIAHDVERESPSARAVVKKLFKAKVQAMVRKGLGLK